MSQRVCDECGKTKEVSGGKTCENGHFVCKDCLWEGTGAAFWEMQKSIAHSAKSHCDSGIQDYRGRVVGTAQRDALGSSPGHHVVLSRPCCRCRQDFAGSSCVKCRTSVGESAAGRR